MPEVVTKDGVSRVVVTRDVVRVVSRGKQGLAGPPGTVTGGISAEVIHSATGKTAIVDADEFPALDSENSSGLIKVTWGAMKLRLKSYFDGLYSATGHSHDSAYEPKNSNIQAHIGITAGNPHGTTATQVGADPAGTAADALSTHEAASNPHPQYLTQAEGDTAYDAAGAAADAISTHEAGTGVHSIAGVTGLQTALDAKIPATEKGAAGGVAPLDGSAKIAAAYLPSYVDDVVEAANFAALPGTGEAGKIYVTLDDNKTYRWSGSAYVEISASPGSTDAVTEGATNLYFTAARVRAVVLTGLSVATNAAITAADTVLSALGKLQAQITGFISDTNTALGNKQDKDTTLTALAGVTTAADKLIYSTGSDTFATTDFPAQARTLLAATDAAGQRTAMGLGTMATQTASAIAITGGTISGITGTAGFTNLSASGTQAVTGTSTLTGNVGIGGAPLSDVALTIGNSSLSSATTTYGLYIDRTYPATSTVGAIGIYSAVRTSASAYTLGNAYALRIGDATKGAGSTITNLHGIHVNDLTQGTNNNGITSLVSAGTNKRSINSSGTAASYHSGTWLLGTNTDNGVDKSQVNGSSGWAGTITAPGTTGDRTINKPVGRVNIAAGGTSITVTNNLVTANSIVIAQCATNDATAEVKATVAASGSFTIHLRAAATAETAINFQVINVI